MYFTKFDDALNREWHGRVWLNPPYSRPTMAVALSCAAAFSYQLLRHYAFDMWMTREFPHILFERYAEGVGSIAYLLKNRFYIGEVVYRGEVNRWSMA
jgi:DNA N-6-adenine-methyltransferase (Dam)